MNAVITIRGLRKSFGATTALNGLDLTVTEGEVHGFLGPNGAGKSTALRILLGLVRADAGQLRLLGGDPWADAVELHTRLAYVPGDVTLWPNLTGGEVIGLLGRLRGGKDEARAAELVERFDLDPTKKCRTYSKGNRQKVSLIAALASAAPLLLLDEPTSGLDPLMEVIFREVIAELREQGSTVLLSSHLLSEVEHLADAVTIIRGGVAVESGTLASLRHLSATMIEATTRLTPTAIAHLPGVHDVTIDADRVRAHVDPDALDAVMAHLAGLGVTALSASPPTLEEVFLSQYSPTQASPPAAQQ
ncbi:MAG: ATP-binding cassette domain-containing protein [Nostocoides sp.]